MTKVGTELLDDSGCIVETVGAFVHGVGAFDPDEAAKDGVSVSFFVGGPVVGPTDGK